jgi:hypothetical protein
MPLTRSQAALDDLLVEVDHELAVLEADSLPARDGLLVTIEVLLRGAERHPDLVDAPFPQPDGPGDAIDTAVLTPAIVRGQQQGLLPNDVPTRQLTLSLRWLIAGILPIALFRRDAAEKTARTIRSLFSEAAADAGRRRVEPAA